MQETIYTARWIVPISQPPIENGFLRVVDGAVAQWGKRQRQAPSTAHCVDLGDVAVIPKPVNAHTHLEFSDCEKPIGEPGIRLADWIGQVIQTRGTVGEDQRSQNVMRGLLESDGFGTGLIGDIATTAFAGNETHPPVAPAPEANLAPDVVSFAEVLGLSEDRGAERFAAAERYAAERYAAERYAVDLPNQLQTPIGISPHAPYSTPLALIDRCIQFSRQHQCPLAMHVAESPDERTLLESGEGPFADSLMRAGLWRENLFPWPVRDPVEHLIERLSAAPRALLIHGNDLRPQEIQRIAKLDNLTVVYCPRTHAFFEYDRHPVAELLAAGVRVALGTDSRASNPDLSVWREIQYLLKHRVDLDPQKVLRMGTVNGAEALLGRGCQQGILLQRESPTQPGFCPKMAFWRQLAMISTTAKNLDQLWRDFAVGKLLCIEHR